MKFIRSILLSGLTRLILDVCYGVAMLYWAIPGFNRLIRYVQAHQSVDYASMIGAFFLLCISSTVCIMVLNYFSGKKSIQSSFLEILYMTISLFSLSGLGVLGLGWRYLAIAVGYTALINLLSILKNYSAKCQEEGL